MHVAHMLQSKDHRAPPPSTPGPGKGTEVYIFSTGHGLNAVSVCTVSSTELSELLALAELSEFLSAYSLCAKVNSPSSSQKSPSLAQN